MRRDETYDVWIEVVGGENSPKYEDERIIAFRENPYTVCRIIKEHADEVNSDSDKYFRVVGSEGSDEQFFSYEEFAYK